MGLEDGQQAYTVTRGAGRVVFAARSNLAEPLHFPDRCDLR